MESKTLHKRFIAATLFSALYGCGGPLVVDYSSTPSFKISSPAAIEVMPYKDLRPTGNTTKTIGAINAVVSDMFGDNIALDKEVSSLVADAFKKELEITGFDIEKESAEFVLTGEVREFRLDVGPRDEIEIELHSELKEKITGNIVWKGVEKVKDSRYAGVMGNTRSTLNDYIVSSLSKAVKKTIKDLAPLTKAASIGDAPQAAETRPAGKLSVATTPPRGKLYIGGVYYGLTPLTIDLAPGVYEIRLILKGYKEESEKVSVRVDGITELEVEFEKE